MDFLLGMLALGFVFFFLSFLSLEEEEEACLEDAAGFLVLAAAGVFLGFLALDGYNKCQ